MARKARTEMIEETRKKLVATARQQFGRVGYADTVMDELTAQAGMTRGALYHHFGDKKGLFLAVAQEIDAEMDARLADISAHAPDNWSAFKGRCRAYLEMTMEPEVQRILLRDSPSVLGAEYLQAGKLQCVASMTRMLKTLMEEKHIAPTSPEVLAHLINGGLMDAAFWIANRPEDKQALAQALDGVELLLNGLKPLRTPTTSA
ncbi:Transposon Tn10 TetC protein [Serratia plymuthica]|jgi:AcrR family transcriptional regulator|uniref:TetR/AcrR family transcriptional regulator n=2 Tax=Serratia plymuthica TaxID=82996 RepID=A0A318NXR4_SERPL|nr:TetR/AcrR family transcriptional regulator [Serratia plymuthica]AGO53526.1 transcriptional regulatory protein [Serratia plymuthica 4Rx13]AGP42879.1 TetR family transcriptional regulator [Serratia plymuthica S13]AHY05570.1 TetR family transcriptional regulator [Serratia plymuthica]ANJ92972.1 TetR family transcriptional regulator [Serratia plymuthica]ANJ96964.1 TetR family transcriptional regulator [Serratia plymuthica]